MTSHDTVFTTAAPWIRPGAIATLFFVLAAVTLASETEAAVKHESRPTTNKVSLDGHHNDWNDIPVIFLEDSLHVVSIAHDEQNLYLMFRFADQRLARDLMKRGVMLWFNGDGKTKTKNGEFAVRYQGSEQIFRHLESEDTTESQTQPQSPVNPIADPQRGGPEDRPKIPDN